MSMRPEPLPAWRLRHAWHGPSDAAALALCREALEAAGLQLADAPPAAPADAAKMHGMELVAARQAGQPPLVDLSALARAADWPRRLPRMLQRYMLDGGRWHGIPLGIHRANSAWVNAGLCERIGPSEPADLAAWLRWLASARALTRSPLAIGGDALQVGLLFEGAVLALAGPQRYRRAFEALDGTVWQEPAMAEALELLMALRAFADDEHLALPWHAQIERVQRGEAAVAVMGDWVRALPPSGLVEWAAPGTAGRFIAIHDFVVPWAAVPAAGGSRAAAPAAGGSRAAAAAVRGACAVPAPADGVPGAGRGDGLALHAERAALALTDAGFQRRFAQRKGCMPALAEAWAEADPARARLLAGDGAVLPSLTLDQCCPPPRKQALLAVVCAHFTERRGAADCARALARASD